MTVLVLQIEPANATTRVLAVEGFLETNTVLEIEIEQAPGIGEFSAGSVHNGVGARKIAKRRRLFNLNTSSIQAGMEPENETAFFDRLMGPDDPDKPDNMRKEDLDLGGPLSLVDQDTDKVRTDIRETQYALRDTMEAVNEQQQLQLAARRTSEDPDRVNMPAHGEYCEALDGQFLHVESQVNGFEARPVVHGLRRIPQGAIWLFQGNIAEVYVHGVGSLAPAATTDVVWFGHNGQAGDFSICILF